MTDNKKTEKTCDLDTNITEDQPVTEDQKLDTGNITLTENHDFSFFVSRYYRLPSNELINKTQRSGRLAPVFGPPSTAKEEAYIRKMIDKDKKLNRG